MGGSHAGGENRSGAFSFRIEAKRTGGIMPGDGSQFFFHFIV